MQRAGLDDLRALVAVGRERSFTKAAARMASAPCFASSLRGQLCARAPGTRNRLENTERIHLLPGSR